MENKEEISNNAKPFIDALNDLQNVIQSCFGQKLRRNILGKVDYSQTIKTFMKSYRKLAITIPLKVS